MLVVPCDGPRLFGRDWLSKLRVNWEEVKSIKTLSTDSSKRLESLLEKHKEIFQAGIGKLKNIKGSITLEKDTQPRFHKARMVPYALRPKIEDELHKLQKEGFIEPVEHSTWATPIVPAVKKNGQIRICGDYRMTLNPVMCVDKYPLLRIEDIFASLAGGQRFSKIDLTQAYHQMEMDEQSKDFLVINTHKGLFRYNRLVFGVASAPAQWQRAIDQVLQNIPFTKCILDDIIVSGSSDEEHLNNLGAVFERLESYGLKTNLEKCEFFRDRISYCGHEIDAQGLHKSPEKLRAVKETRRPENVTEVRAYLGLVNYYHRFLEHLSTVAAPLHELLHDNKVWKWTPQCETAFQKIKEMICSDKVLCHFDPSLPLNVACDASPFGIGCVLSHMFPDNTERPIAFASRTLNKAETGYSQIDKEALSLYWGVRKFSTYLYGHKFTLVTAHKPLLGIFNPSKALPAMTAARLQRYAVFLSSHQYDIEYKSTKKHLNADALSRLPLAEVDTSEGDGDPIDIFYTTQWENVPVSCEKICTETRRDPVLSQVLDFVMSGHFPNQEDSDLHLKPFLTRKDELNAHQGCLVWGNRVIIPESLRSKVLDEIHSGHVGIVKMKMLSRSYVWWPNLDKDIETMCKTCRGCVSSQNIPPAAPVYPWKLPGTPW